MANICDNHFILRSRNLDDFNKSKEALEEYVNEVGGEITYDDEEDLFEGYFDSKWTFPIEDLKNIIVGDVYFRCLSEEYGEEYVAMNIYDNGWRDEQCFDL